MKLVYFLKCMLVFVVLQVCVTHVYMCV